MNATNPALRRLGLSDTDRVVIIHADDIGMCQASLTAYAKLIETGGISSAAVMPPCSWFPAAAAFCRAHPDVDMGVHTTLTCEWDAYRWGPLSTRDPASGLMDNEGYFHRSTQAAQLHAEPAAAQRELAAQVEHARAAGIPLTHIDTHMGAVMHTALIRGYVELALRHHLVPMIPRMDKAQLQQRGMSAEDADHTAGLFAELESAGVPLIDHITGMPLSDPRDQLDYAQRAFDALPPGISVFILHPAEDTPELRAIAPDWPGRVANFETFMRPEIPRYLKQIGAHVIGYRALQALLPQSPPAPANMETL